MQEIQNKTEFYSKQTVPTEIFLVISNCDFSVQCCLETFPWDKTERMTYLTGINTHVRVFTRIE